MFPFAAAGFLMTLLLVVNRQYNYMLDDSPGFDYEQLAYCSVGGLDKNIARRVLEEVSRLPEVEEACLANSTLLGRLSGNNVSLPDTDRELFNVADMEWANGNFLEVMGIPVIQGRLYLETDSISNEVMVSRKFVEKMKELAGWTDSPIGKQIDVTMHRGITGKPFTICGVFEDVRLGFIGNEDERPAVLFCYEHPRIPFNYLIIRYHKQTPEANQRVQELLQALVPDKEMAVYSYPTEIRNGYTESRRFRDAVLIGSLVTLIITLIGLVGYTKDEMNRRRKETAIRKVNGATLSDILRMFMTDILRIALPALVLGGGISAYIANNWLAQFSEKISLSPLIFLASGIALLVVVLGAVAINCHRAANENPAVNIKNE